MMCRRSATTRRGQFSRNLSQRVLEQVSQPRVREPQLCLRRPRREHTKTPRSRTLDTLEPKRRLPDPRFALQHKGRDLSSRRSIEKSMQRTKLLIPAHDIHDWTNLLTAIVSRRRQSAGIRTLQSPCTPVRGAESMSESWPPPTRSPARRRQGLRSRYWRRKPGRLSSRA